MRREIYTSFRLVSLLLVLINIAFGDWEPVETVGLQYPPLARMARISGIVSFVHLSGPMAQCKKLPCYLDIHCLPSPRRRTPVSGGSGSWGRVDRPPTCSSCIGLSWRALVRRTSVGKLSGQSTRTSLWCARRCPH